MALAFGTIVARHSSDTATTREISCRLVIRSHTYVNKRRTTSRMIPGRTHRLTLTGLPSRLPSLHHPAYTPARSRRPHHPTPDTRTAQQSRLATHASPAESSHSLQPASRRNTPHAASASAHIPAPPRTPLPSALTPTPST